MFQVSLNNPLICCGVIAETRKGYPYVSPAHRSTSVAQGQLLSLPDTFAGPSTAPRSTSVTEEQWLDPQLVSGLALQENEEAEEEIGAWSL